MKFHIDDLPVSVNSKHTLLCSLSLLLRRSSFLMTEFTLVCLMCYQVELKLNEVWFCRTIPVHVRSQAHSRCIGKYYLGFWLCEQRIWAAFSTITGTLRTWDAVGNWEDRITVVADCVVSTGMYSLNYRSLDTGANHHAMGSSIRPKGSLFIVHVPSQKLRRRWPSSSG